MNYKYIFPVSLILICNAVVSAQPLIEADAWLEDLDRSLQWESEDRFWYLDVQGQLDFWAYAHEGNQPSSFFFPPAGKDEGFSPRFTLFTDLFIGKHWLASAKFRWDDGVHPGVGEFYGDHTQVRADEFFLKWSPGPHLHIQAGQFTPRFGNFLSRQNSWDMPLISYPYMYEQVTSVSDSIIPSDSTDFAQRRNAPDNKLVWVPVNWAPLYPRGIMTYGKIESFNYALSLMNTNSSSRGVTWNNNDWNYPTLYFRGGYSPDPAWEVGLNVSHGSYLQHSSRQALPQGASLKDFMQTNLALDFNYQHGHWDFWSEIFVSSFDIPNVDDDARIYSYYLEAKYQLTPQIWISARWNQELYNEITTPTGSQRWDNPAHRADIGIGYRIIRHLQVKLQYSRQRQDADFQNGRHFYALETTLRF